MRPRPRMGIRGRAWGHLAGFDQGCESGYRNTTQRSQWSRDAMMAHHEYRSQTRPAVAARAEPAL